MRSNSVPPIIAATLLALTLVICGPTLQAQEPSASPSSSPSPSPATAVPFPIALARVPSEAESAFGELHQIEESVSKDRATLESTADGLSSLTSEIKNRMLEDNRILAGNPSLDLLFRLRTTLQTYADELSKAEQDLTQRVANLETQISRLSQMNQVWQTTLKSAPQVDMPAAVIQRAKSLLDEITKSKQAAESDRDRVLTLQSEVLLEDGQSRAASREVARAESRALKDLLVQDGRPIWSALGTLTSEWNVRSADTFTSQWDATTAFVRRSPSSFILHAFWIAVLAILVQWLRRRVRKLSDANPAPYSGQFRFWICLSQPRLFSRRC